MEDTRSRWDRALSEAVDFDSWGQVEEALEGYQRLQVAAAAEYVENVLQLPLVRRDGIGRLASTLKMRIEELSKNTNRGIGLQSMKALKAHMKDLIVSDAPFPLAGVKAEGPIPTGPMTALNDATDIQAEEPDEATTSGDGTLRTAPAGHRRGDTSLTIFIDKWGFKEAAGFYEPRVVVSVRDEFGENIEAVQETPQGKTSANYVFFENTVYVQTPVNQMSKGAAIFFEFRHYKASKGKRSIKAYCYMELDEIKNGPINLEVYKKPANYKRTKKPSLLTVKPLYLHLDLTVERL